MRGGDLNPWLAFTVYTKKYYEFCEYFASANKEDDEKVKNNKAIVEIIKTKNSFNIISFISIEYLDFSI